MKWQGFEMMVAKAFNENSVPMENKAPLTTRRWYEQDALLSEVLSLLSEYPEEFTVQAAEFLGKLEAEVGAEAIESFYAQAKAQIGQENSQGKRWYDADPVLFKAIELLRVLPPVVQRQAAERFLRLLRQV